MSPDSTNLANRLLKFPLAAPVAAAADAGTYSRITITRGPVATDRDKDGDASYVPAFLSDAERAPAQARDTAARDVGMAPKLALSHAILGTVRDAAVKSGYDPIADLETPIPVDAQFLQANQAILKKTATPLASNADVQATGNLLAGGYFDAATITDAASTLRGRSADAYAQGRNVAGSAFKQQANEIESLLDRHLQNSDADPSILTKYRAARQLIAKTHDIQEALNDAAGSVDASAIGNLLGIAPAHATHGASVALIPAARLAATKWLTRRNSDPSLLQPAGKSFADNIVDAIHGSGTAFQKYYGYAAPSVLSAPPAQQQSSDGDSEQ